MFPLLSVDFISAFAAAIRPRRRLALSEWADAHRLLSSKASSEPGPWKTSRTPYLREIMDCLSVHSPVEQVVAIKCAQIGLTEVALNWIGYVVEHAPSPMLVVAPTLEVRDRWSMQRLNPLLRDTPEIAELFDGLSSRTASNAKDLKDFPGGVLVLSGANSASSLRSMPIRYVVCDEVDAFPWEIGDEGDPLGLIRMRQANFPRRKTLLISTPTIKDASRIDEEYEQSDKRRFHIPCPHCGEFQHLKWQNLHWSKSKSGRVIRVAYVCEHCGSEIEEHHKTAMLAAGKWIAEKPDMHVRGYHINGLYAPIGLGYSWQELAQQWLNSHDDPPKLKRFINTVLGEAWEDRSRDVKPATLAERAEDYALRIVPPGCLLLTAGVDTQNDRLAVQILGWGRGMVCWVLDWIELPGDPSRDELWIRLTDLLNTPLRNTFGIDMRIQSTAIDTGGHHTHDVYAYVRGMSVPRLMAIKGSATPSKPILGPRPQAQDINHRGKTIRKGVKLWMIGTDTAKHMLTSRLLGDAGTESSGRRIRFSKDLPDDYYSQMTSEAFDPEKNKWVKRRGRRNEALDTWVYGCAAAHHPEIRVHALRERDWQQLARIIEPEKIEEGQQQPPEKGQIIKSTAPGYYIP